jgi:hypothetical protein
MKVLYVEITRRFPGVQSLVHEGDEELPYLVIGLIADWLRSLSPAQITLRLSYSFWSDHRKFLRLWVLAIIYSFWRAYGLVLGAQN